VAVGAVAAVARCRPYNCRIVKDTFYITSPIYYVNDEPHIGHGYDIVCCDVIARYHRLRGEKVFFLTGTDEHGQKIARAAEEQGLDPQTWTDRIVPRWKEVWERLGISYDDFIRTTEERHTGPVQEFWQGLHDRGEIYLGTYEGPYCVSCEEFKIEAELRDGNCPIHGRPVERISEDNYFFPLSKYQGALLALYEEHPEFVQPDERRNEVFAFVRGGLQDLSISRTSIDWGVPVPWDPKHVIYVWIDALQNYITAAGFGSDPERFGSLWPADVHMVGKDILRFHAVIWPAMLMAADLPLPRSVFAHGWLLVGGEKMSKTRLTGIHPFELTDVFGVDAYRYYFLREISFGRDGSFSWESMVARYNADLANGLGNLASRVLAMVDSYFGGEVPEPSSRGGLGRLSRPGTDLARRFDEHMTALRLTEAVAALDAFVREANRYLVEAAPWTLAKDPERRQELADALYEAVEALRLIAVFSSPVMPGAAERLWTQLGITDPIAGQRIPEAAEWGRMVPGTRIQRGDSLFPRLET
jgi:methionyl-tRNA synthetase